MFSKFHLVCLIFFLAFISSVSIAADRDFMDSIGVQKIGDRTFIVHQVVGEETLFSISRRYKVPMVAIQEANEVLKQGMKDGQTLLIPHGQSNEYVSTSEPSSVSLTATSSTPVGNPSAISTKVESPVSDVQTSTSSNLAAKETSLNSKTKSLEATSLVLKTTHKIVRGESLFSIANKYNVTVSELQEWNSLTGNKILVGQSLKIFALEPIESKRIAEPPAQVEIPSVEKKEEAKKEEPKEVGNQGEKQKVDEGKIEQSKVIKESNSSPSPTPSMGEWISHTVKSGESLFSLSNQYGNSIEDLIRWNALTSNNLKVGQSIKVGKAVANDEGAEVKSQPSAVNTEPVKKIEASAELVEKSKEVMEAPKQEVYVPNTSGGFTNTKETGLAEVIPGTEANKKYLVLHRTAPVGSIIRVKNEENSLMIFARVVGVLPETGDNSKVLIKLSQAAFEQLKGVNSRFPVEILY